MPLTGCMLLVSVAPSPRYGSEDKFPAIAAEAPSGADSNVMLLLSLICAFEGNAFVPFICDGDIDDNE